MKTFLPMKRTAVWLLIAAIGAFVASHFLFQSPSAKAPKARDGFLDLSEWDFLRGGLVALNGDWEFYPNALLNPSELKNEVAVSGKRLARVPGRWVDGLSEGDIGDRGIGTYRIRVAVAPDVRMYGLRSDNIRSSSKAFVNGIEAGASGNPAASKDAGGETKVVPLIAYFPSADGMLDIVVQVANLDYYNGGMIQPVYLGSKESVQNDDFKEKLYETLGVAALLLSAVYYLGIYVNRRKDKRFVYFALFCLLHAYIAATGGEKIFILLFDSLPYMWVLKAKIAAICMSVLISALLIRELGDSFMPKAALRTIGAVMGLGAMTIVSVPVSNVATVEQAMGPSYVLAYGWMATLVVLAIRRKRYGRLGKRSSLLLVGAIGLTIFSYISSFLYFFSMLTTDVFPLLSLLTIMLGAGALFVKQYSNAYDDLERLSLELIETDKRKDEFLLHTSHEFKTPLHGIMNMARALSETGEPASNNREKLVYIISIAERLSSLVNDIIDVQSLRDNKLRLTLRSFDVNGTALAVLEMLKDMRRGDDIRFVNHVPPGSYYVHADENRFKQIMVNLVGNALKYTEKGYIEIGADARGGEVLIRVTDTGIGMDEATKRSLFTAGAGTETVNYADVSSNGLGLAISKMLAVGMGGDLELTASEPGAGSTFELRLPQAIQEESRDASDAVELLSAELVDRHVAEAAPALEEANDERLKLLIVDDEPSNVRVLQEVFNDGRHEIVVAYNGHKALELLKKRRDWSIVLLDVMMPGLSGYEVCKRIRELYAPFELPVLLLTVRNTSQDIAVGLEAGANDFVVKPFDAKELKARVRTHQRLKEAVEEAIKLESAFLQSQIKPHFLYNALSIIVSLCHSDGPRAGELLEELGNYLRGTFDINPHAAMVALAKEISLVKSYAELEKARFGDRLNVEWAVRDELLGVSVPAMTLQPLVENAVRHGLMKRIAGGTVRISAELRGDEAVFSVVDDGAGIPRERLAELLDDRKRRSGVGLYNVHKRLINEYGQGLRITSETGGGTIVSFSVPVNRSRS